jgi:hypothetical protein
LRLMTDLFLSCLMATKMRTRSPIFLIPISWRIFWSHSMRLFPLKLLAARVRYLGSQYRADQDHAYL